MFVTGRVALWFRLSPEKLASSEDFCSNESSDSELDSLRFLKITSSHLSSGISGFINGDFTVKPWRFAAFGVENILSLTDRSTQSFLSGLRFGLSFGPFIYFTLGFFLAAQTVGTSRLFTY